MEDFSDMKWGSFGAVHFATLVLAVAMIVALYYVLKKANKKIQIAVLGVLSFSGIAAVIYNLLMWGDPINYLPLHLCSINALLLPFAVFSRNTRLCNLLLVWSLGAVAALVMNSVMAEVELASWTFFFFYFPHVMEFAVPILLFKLGLARKEPRCIGSTIVISMGIYTVVHFINLIINHYTDAGVNYMYSLEPINPLMELFYKVIPYDYWYMYMIVPILTVYLLIVYAPQLLAKKKEKAKA